MPRLSETEIKELLNSLAGWGRDGDSLVRTLEFETFLKAVDFVHRVASIAEVLNHHPDIDIRYNKVTLKTTTHDEDNKLTGKDFELAKRINELCPPWK